MLLTSIVGKEMITGKRREINAKFTGEGKFKNFIFKAIYPYTKWLPSLDGLSYPLITNLPEEYYSLDAWEFIEPSTVPESVQPEKVTLPTILLEDKVYPLKVTTDAVASYFMSCEYSIKQSVKRDGVWVVGKLNSIHPDVKSELLLTTKPAFEGDRMKYGYVVIDHKGHFKYFIIVNYDIKINETITDKMPNVSLDFCRLVDNKILKVAYSIKTFPFSYFYGLTIDKPINSSEANNVIYWLNESIYNAILNLVNNEAPELPEEVKKGETHVTDIVPGS